ncbi:MAG: peptide chain release factor 1 [Chloroflexi bacterium]|nr:peptide chain release factor 1 [Chloroflexota bacterium]
MTQQLETINERYKELEDTINNPEFATDYSKIQEVAKEKSSLESVVALYHRYRKVQTEINDTEEIIAHENDKELVELALDDLSKLKIEVGTLEIELLAALRPKDPRDSKNVIIEIRAGTGGGEASLFAGDLYRMYARYAEEHRWAIDILNSSETELGGVKEIVFQLNGKGVYGRLKFEGGTHRVQRVPATETSGRIHTSAATVVVLPEVDEVEVEIRTEDLDIETMRAGGHGGQNVNKVSSAVRIVHRPTGLTVACQDERSQHRNKDKAMAILRARLFDLEQKKQAEEISAERRPQVGSGDRSEKIRTYNFPQNRVTDHRIGVTLHNLPQMLNGQLDGLLDQLSAAANEN